MNTIKSLLVLVALVVLSAGCSNIETRLRKVPGISFEAWSHSDRYGPFTDKITVSGAKWTLNADGSATLMIDNYDVEATWAGALGPHDTMSKLVVNFPPTSPQAVALTRGLVPAFPSPR